MGLNPSVHDERLVVSSLSRPCCYLCDVLNLVLFCCVTVRWNWFILLFTREIPVNVRMTMLWYSGQAGVLFVTVLTFSGPSQFIGRFFIYCFMCHHLAKEMIVWILVFRYSAEAGIHTEHMPGGLALIIPTLQERHAGNYTCTAKYANTELLSKSVLIKTFGESCATKPNCEVTLKLAVTSFPETTPNDHLIN